MDERKIWRSTVKRAYRKAKRKHVSAWKGLFVFFTIAALLVGFGGKIIESLKASFSTVTTLIGAAALNSLERLAATRECLFVAAVLGALAAVMLILWICGGVKLRKSAGYLNYMTMKRARKAEQQRS